jgi:D-alanyl-D-alanine carboxypeptidase
MLSKIFLILIILIEFFPLPWLQVEVNKLFSKQPFYLIEQIREEKLMPSTVDFDEIKDLPQQKQKKKIPEIKAKSILLMDKDTSFVLFAKNQNVKRPIASLAKIMTALVVLEKKKLSEVAIVGEEIYKLDPEESRMNLEVGERITVENLLYGLLVSSAGDAAVVLARAVAGSERKFVELMNKKAKDLGLKNTVFADSRGFSPKNQSTAFEIAILTSYILRNTTISNIVKTKEVALYSVDGRFKHDLKTTNKLLTESNLPITGFKTGYTEKAGESLVATAEKDNHTIIAVVLNSSDRFAESEKLLEWFFDSYEY